MPLYHAKLIYTAVDGQPLKDHVIATTDQGTILSILPLHDYSDQSQIKTFPGIIVPGFINAHCHLELSHMKGMIPTGTGLVEFIKQIVTRRSADASITAQAIDLAELEMYDQGIVAIGDISNVVDTFDQKSKSKLRYHTFIETFDLMQGENAHTELKKSKDIYDQLFCPVEHKKSIVPHATYSVSHNLFHLLQSLEPSQVSISIHHQETDAENEFIAKRTGALVDFFKGFGLSLDQYVPTGLSASSVPIDYMSPMHKTLLVHNTMSTPEDILKIEAWNNEVYWVTCPNANLYIENRLPHYQYWLDLKCKMCIGTDSLASNWQLSVLEEIKTIQRYQSYVPFAELIRWATIHGAEALGFDHALGSIEIGKTPGLVHIYPFDVENYWISTQGKCERII